MRVLLSFVAVAVIVCVSGVLGANPNYSYHVKIADPVEANYQEKAETRKGDYAEGFYSVVQPDGQLRTVTYTADEWGFHPIVSYSYGHPVPPVKKVLVAAAQPPVVHSVPSVSYQQVYAQGPAAVVPQGGGYQNFVNTGTQYAATYGTPVFSVKESRQFIKDPAAAAAAAAVLSTPTGGYSYPAPQQLSTPTGGYSYPAPQQQLQSHVEKQVAQPVVVAQPPKLEVVHQPFVHVVQPPVETYVQHQAQFSSELQKIHPAPIVHQYINHAPRKIQYFQPQYVSQPQVVQKQVQYVSQPQIVQKQVQYVSQPQVIQKQVQYVQPAQSVQYIPPPPVVVEQKPAPAPVQPTTTYLPPKKEVVLTQPVATYIPPPPKQEVVKVVSPPSLSYLPPPPPPAPKILEVEYKQFEHIKKVPFVQPQEFQVIKKQPIVQHHPQIQHIQKQPVQEIQHIQQQPSVQYVAPAPVVQKQVQYVQPQQQIQYFQQPASPPVAHRFHHQTFVQQQPQIQYVQQPQQQHVQYVQETPVIEQQQVVEYSPVPVPVQHYAPQHMTYAEPLAPTILEQSAQVLPPRQTIQKYEDIVVQNLGVMRYAAAPVRQFLAPAQASAAPPGPLKLLAQPVAVQPALIKGGKQNPLTFNFGYDTGVAKVSHSYYGSGW